MGKGDKRSTKGKIWRGSHGKKRAKKSNKPQPSVESIPKQAQ
ncbi:MAG: 30S ribosomal protein THX [Saprospirales bacterium]|nr:30S ribosomal protein THX [Saprospirales bacterium]MBK6903218.1 30S ribosomal protein THX [Saprospirales bacterium]MBK7334768.1 30S ribosomal protein THX [Saprospirales bacterium]